MDFDISDGSNIVSLMPRRAQTAFTALRDVEAYWEGLRNGRPVPARGEIDPRGIQSALEYAFILERIAPGVARIRLAGLHLTDLMGMDVRGMPFTAMFMPESRAQIGKEIEAVCATPQVTTITLQGDQGIGRGYLQAQLLLCPLKSDLGDVNRILGCLQSNGKIGRQPRRFTSLKVTARPLLTETAAPPRVGSRQDKAAEADTALAPEVGEARKDVTRHAPLSPTAEQTSTPEVPPRATGKPALRLVKAED